VLEALSSTSRLKAQINSNLVSTMFIFSSQSQALASMKMAKKKKKIKEWLNIQGPRP
jgi:hypothetical protein